MNSLLILCGDEEAKRFPINEAAAAVYGILGQKAPLSAEIAFVGEDEIRKLNREQRKVDKITDVLSFPYLDGIRGEVIDEEDFKGDFDEETGAILIGSVCICLKRAEEQAKEYGHSLEREVVYLATHGLLHCFGYDHRSEEEEEEMTALAEKAMEKIGLKR